MCKNNLYDSEIIWREIVWQNWGCGLKEQYEVTSELNIWFVTFGFDLFYDSKWIYYTDHNMFNPFPDDKNLTLSKLEAFADDKINVT